MPAPAALDDAAWAAIASMATSVGTLIAVLAGNRKSSVIEQKVDTTADTASAIQHSVTTPNGDPRTLAAIISEAHPEQVDEANKTPGT